MAVWLVRGGRDGEREEFALEHGACVIGWDQLPDLAGIKTREKLDELCRNTYPNDKQRTVSNWVGQIWAFLNKIKADDLVVMPLKTRGAVAIGRVTGDYAYKSDWPADARHMRPVSWTRTDVPRGSIDSDLLYSMGALQTVCQIQRNDAEARLKALLAGGKTPTGTGGSGKGGDGVPLDLEGYARDLIRQHIGHRFTGHSLERLVTAVLRAQGYQAKSAPIGADGGVDVLAGRGPLGFDEPRLCVQIKSSDQPLDVKSPLFAWK